MPQACSTEAGFQDSTSHLMTQATAEQKTKCSVQPVFLKHLLGVALYDPAESFFARHSTKNSINKAKHVCSIPAGFSQLKYQICKLQLIWQITNEHREDYGRPRLMLAN